MWLRISPYELYFLFHDTVDDKGNVLFQQKDIAVTPDFKW